MTAPLEAPAFCRRWCMKVELTFPVAEEDVRIRYEGDAEVDFAFRALQRIRPELEALLERIGPDAHYTILGETVNGEWRMARRVLG